MTTTLTANGFVITVNIGIDLSMAENVTFSGTGTYNDAPIVSPGNITFTYYDSDGVVQPVEQAYFNSGNYSVSFTVQPGSYTISYVIVFDNTGANAEFNTAINFIITSICIHPDMLIETSTGIKKISDIYGGDLVKKQNNEWINILFNIVSCMTADFYKINKDALGKNIPNSDFFIHGDHPVWYNGAEHIPEELIDLGLNVDKIKLSDPVLIYSLCTTDRRFIKTVSNLDICTFSKADFETFVENKDIVHNKQ